MSRGRLIVGTYSISTKWVSMMICETKYSNNKLVSQNKVSYRPHPRYITLIIIEHVESNYLSKRLKCLRNSQLVDLWLDASNFEEDPQRCHFETGGKENILTQSRSKFLPSTVRWFQISWQAVKACGRNRQTAGQTHKQKHRRNVERLCRKHGMWCERKERISLHYRCSLLEHCSFLIM